MVLRVSAIKGVDCVKFLSGNLYTMQPYFSISFIEKPICYIINDTCFYITWTKMAVHLY